MTTAHRRRRAGSLSPFPLGAAALCVLSAGTALAADRIDRDQRPIGRDLELTALSSRADMVTGGDVLVRISLPNRVNARDLRITLNGTDVSTWFRPEAPQGGARSLVGRLVGLRVGPNELRARGDGHAETLRLTNHPLTGPVFSGPQEQPFYCQTHQFRVYPNGPFLTSAPIANPCHVPTRVDHVYRATDNTFKALPAGPLPPDLMQTTTLESQTVPYIVRLETGTVNRAIYQTAVLDNPAIAGPDERRRADPGWNGRLAYTFGGGCGGGQYIQGSSTGGVLNDMMLSRGFAVASASLNVLGQNCNDVTSAETVMMVKERFIESYGLPRWTVGWGCSGGGIQQYMIGDNYPGLLDGLLPQCSFPDVYASSTFDARLLLEYFRTRKAVPWTEDELREASGFGTFGQIVTQGTSWAARIDPVPGRLDYPSWLYNAVVPVDVRYHPVTNPTGARATTYDHNLNTFGRDENGFARRPLDNVGVQYGLATLNAGKITKAQFLDLNEKVGGLDIDANFTPQRMVADPLATRAAHETGKVVNGGGGLASVPILDFDVIYTDLLPAGDVHMKYYHFSTRERLVKANGHARNMVMWSGVFGPRAAVATQAFLSMTAWLDNIAADTSNARDAVKVVRNRPADLTDGCWTGEAAPFGFIAERQFLGGPGTSACNDLYPGYGFPKFEAGMPLANDIVKCQLKPIQRRDYAVAFTQREWEQLHTIFPEGVCNFDRRGMYQRDLLGTWLRYTDVGEYERDRR